MKNATAMETSMSAVLTFESKVGSIADLCIYLTTGGVSNV
jgi:hypothetical protein